MRLAGLLLGFVAAAVCVRLGWWQLDRHEERRAWNAQVEGRLAAPPVTVVSGRAPSDFDDLAYRRARAVGVFAFGDQVTEGNKSHRGAPGVYVLTPLRFADGTGILVNRGWTYAPDGMTAELAPLDETDTASVEGVLLPPSGRLAVLPDTLAVGYPLHPLILRRVAEGGDSLPTGLVAALLPARDAGPHLSYAVQWFAFALIAVVGGGLLARRSAGERPVPG